MTIVAVKASDFTGAVASAITRRRSKFEALEASRVAREKREARCSWTYEGDEITPAGRCILKEHGSEVTHELSGTPETKPKKKAGTWGAFRHPAVFRIDEAGNATQVSAPFRTWEEAEKQADAANRQRTRVDRAEGYSYEARKSVS